MQWCKRFTTNRASPDPWLARLVDVGVGEAASDTTVTVLRGMELCQTNGRVSGRTEEWFRRTHLKSMPVNLAAVLSATESRCIVMLMYIYLQNRYIYTWSMIG